MFSLTYTSNAAVPFRKEAILSLLVKAHARNHIHGVTGMLLYDHGAFLQVLEGRKFDVEAIFASIRRDPRHKDIRVIEKHDISTRQFGAWTMAYNDLSLGVARPLEQNRAALSELSPTDASSYLGFYCAHAEGRR